MFDTRPAHIVVTPTQPLTFGVPGHGGIPGTAKAVQFAVTIVSPTTSGVLRVKTTGTVGTVTSAVAYVAGKTTAAMLSVPLVNSQSIVFTPTSGSMYLLADVMGYSASTGQSVSVGRADGAGHLCVGADRERRACAGASRGRSQRHRRRAPSERRSVALNRVVTSVG